ncbi:MAG: DUF1624 domain-containing protein [Beijerinckiaceae bacterium]
MLTSIVLPLFTRRTRAARLPLVDAARGTAILAMFVFHLTWDFAYFGYIDSELIFTPAFKLIAHAIASSFLGLAGISLVLAHGASLRTRGFLRHLGVILIAAGAVSLATYIFVPDGFIFFGILHCIALSIIIALPFLFLPWWAAGLAAAAAIAAPFIFVSPAFDAPLLWWTGLSSFEPRTNDYQPILPWLAALLCGVALMKLGDRFALRTKLSHWQPRTIAARGLVIGGRHSLAIYLVHQPIFFGVVFLLAAIVPPPAGSADARFFASCRTQCESAPRSQTTCNAICTCVADEAREEGLWERAVAGALKSEERERLSLMARSCLRQQQIKEE